MMKEDSKPRKNAAVKQEKSEMKPYYDDSIPEIDVMLDEDTAKNVTNVEKADD